MAANLNVRNLFDAIYEDDNDSEGDDIIPDAQTVFNSLTTFTATVVGIFLLL